MDANDFFAGKDPRFPRPLVADAFASSGGYVSYVPIEFRDGIRVTTERRCGFYNALWHSYADAEGVTDGWPTGDRLERLVALFGHRGSWRDVLGVGAAAGVRRIEGKFDAPPGKSATIADIRGRGPSTRSASIPSSPHREDLMALRMRICWDDEAEPAVDVPLGMFFGSGLGEAHVTARSSGCPHRATVQRDADALRDAGPDRGRQRHRPSGGIPRRRRPRRTGLAAGQDRPPPRPAPAGVADDDGRDYTIVDAAGRGSFVGYVLAIRPFEPKNKCWWEATGGCGSTASGRRPSRAPATRTSTSAAGRTSSSCGPSRSRSTASRPWGP